MELKKIDWLRNLWKAFFMSFSIGFLSVLTYGIDMALIIANLIVTTILAFFANSVVDVFYYYRDAKKELKEKR